MKPRTKFDRKIIELKDSLPPVSNKIKKWTYQKFIKPVGFTSNGDIGYCGHCGKSFPIKEVIGAYMDEMKNRKKDPCGYCPRFQCDAHYDWKEKDYQFKPQLCSSFRVKDLNFDTYCPHCKKRLLMHFSKKRKIYESQHISILMQFKGFQVWRHSYLIFEFTKGKQWNCETKDKCVIWINENGSFRSVRNKFRGYNDHDSKGKVIPSLTNDESSRYGRYQIGKYCINLYPEFDLADYLKIRGLSLLSSAQLESYNRHDTEIFHEGANPVLFIKYLLKYPFIETLIKKGDFETLHTFFSYSKKEFETILPSYLIMKRHHYIPSDLKMWIDMVLLYHGAGKDIRNPKFICPQDLQKGHEEAQKLYEIAREKRNKAQREEWERIRPRDIWWFLDHHPEEEDKCVGNDRYLFKLAEQFGGLEPGWHIYLEEFADDTTGDIITIKRWTNEYGLYRYPFLGNVITDLKIREENNNRFEKLKGRYCNVEFEDEDLKVKTLNSWEEYYEEGMKMHNCIETNAYWNKPSSLILSVRKDDELVAHVEISLRTFKILQCWGPCNQPTPYREKIATLIEKNIHLIRDRINAK